MSPNYWGPHVWKLLHVLVSAISDEGYELLKIQIYQIIYHGLPGVMHTAC